MDIREPNDFQIFLWGVICQMLRKSCHGNKKLPPGWWFSLINSLDGKISIDLARMWTKVRYAIQCYLFLV